MPRISVVIPVYNHQNYIVSCVRSVLEQTYKDFEIVVVDDGSTDATSQILAGFGNSIKYIRQENRGGAAALNTAIRNSCGEYIAWLSSDDEFLPGKLQLQLDFLERNPGIDLAYTDFYIIDTIGRVLSSCRSAYYTEKKSFLYHMLAANFINGATVMFKRSCLEKVGYFDEELKYHADSNMWFRMLKYYRFGHLPELLLRYRWHTKNLSHHFTAMKKYYYLYYEKIFLLYDDTEFFPEQTSVADARLRLAEILEKHRIYSLAFAKVASGIRIKPAVLFKLNFWVPFVLRLPLQFIIDIGLRIFSWQQRHFALAFLSKLYFRLNTGVVRVD